MNRADGLCHKVSAAFGYRPPVEISEFEVARDRMTHLLDEFISRCNRVRDRALFPARDMEGKYEEIEADQRNLTIQDALIVELSFACNYNAALALQALQQETFEINRMVLSSGLYDSAHTPVCFLSNDLGAVGKPEVQEPLLGRRKPMALDRIEAAIEKVNRVRRQAEVLRLTISHLDGPFLQQTPRAIRGSVG